MFRIAGQAKTVGEKNRKIINYLLLIIDSQVRNDSALG